MCGRGGAVGPRAMALFGAVPGLVLALVEVVGGLVDLGRADGGVSGWLDAAVTVSPQ